MSEEQIGTAMHMRLMIYDAMIAELGDPTIPPPTEGQNLPPCVCCNQPAVRLVAGAVPACEECGAGTCPACSEEATMDLAADLIEEEEAER